MPSNESDQQQGVGDFRERAKNEVRKAIEEAEQSSNPEEVKKELAKKLVEQVIEVVEEAKEVVENEEKAKKGQEAALKQEEKKTVTARFIKLIEAVKQGIVVAKKPEAQAFLQKVVEEIPSPSTSQTNQLVAYLSPYFLGEKDIVVNPPDQTPSEFQKDFEILASVNPQLAEKVKQALEKGMEEGKIVSIKKDEIERLIIKGTTNETTLEFQGIMLEEERAEYVRMWRDIEDRYQKISSTMDSIKKSELDKKINQILMSFLPVKDLSILRDLGFNEEEIQRFLYLREKFNQSLDTRFLGQYTPILSPVIEQAKRDFADIERFFSVDEAGNIKMSKEQKQAFEELIRKYFYRGLSIIHQNTSQDFHSVFRDKMELNYYFSLISQIVTHTCDRIKQRLPDKKEYEELRLFFEDKSESFMSRIMNNAQLFHNLPLYARNLGSIEEIKKLFSYIYPSQLAEVFDDESNLMTIARDELTMLLREYLAKNKNEYRGDLLSGKYNEEGARWSEWFKEEYKKRLKDKLRRLGIYRGEEDEWKLDMLRTYSEGIGIATLIDGEILATSDPVSHFLEVHPLMSLLSAKHNWKGGRGREGPGLINRFLLGMDVDLLPQERPFLARLVSKKRFVPNKFYQEVEKKIRDYSGAIIDEMTDGRSKASLFGMGGLYQELISMFNLPGDILSWGGWRVQGVTEELGKIYQLIYGIDSPSSPGQWRDFFDLSLELYGTTSLWWQIGIFGGSRPTKEVQKLLEEKFSKSEAHRLEKEHPNDKVIEIDGRKMSFFELRMWRMNQLRGELFFRYLRRNPGDFLQIMVQLCPEILDKKGEFFTSEKEEDKRKRNAYIKRFGQKNFEIFKKINVWMRDAVEAKGGTGEFLFINPETGKAFTDLKTFMVYFRERTSDAFERMKSRNEETRRKIISIATDSNLSDEEKKDKINEIRKRVLYLSKEDFSEEDQKIWEIFAVNSDSFFKTITGLSYDEADQYFLNFGLYNELGKENIFFALANNWILRNGDINPFNSDIAYYDIFRHITDAGESILSRLHDANISTFKEVLSQIPNLETILLHAAENGNLEEINKLHQKVFNTLSGLVGLEYAYRANYILAQIVSNFFIEHSVLRDPKWKWLGPIGWLLRGTFGYNTSLSKLLTHNIHAYSMDNNALRTYFMHLAHDLHVLPVEGIFSKDQLEKVFEVTTKEFVIGDVGPSLLWFIFLFLLFNAIKKGLEEVEGKKK